MPITEKMREKRKKYLGSSDAAAVLGLDPYRTPADVYLDKTDQIQASGRAHDNDATEVGTWCEDAVLRWFSDKFHFDIIRNQFRVADNGIMAANLDAIVKNEPVIEALEAKTTAVTSRYVGEEWGEVETDEVPDRIKLQCYHQMACVPTLAVIWIPVLMGGVGLRHYRIERKQEVIDDLTAAEVAFWNDHVAKLVPPPDSLPSLDTFKKLRREEGKKVVVPDDIIGRWLEARTACTQADKQKKELERQVLAALGDAEIGESSLGTLSYNLRHVKGYTVEPSERRQLTFRKVKR